MNPLLCNEPYFEIVFAPKHIVTNEYGVSERLVVQRAIESGQLASDALDGKYNFYAIHRYQFAEEVLAETAYNLIWQEQLEALFCRVGGFSPAESDNIRRHIAKRHMFLIYGEVRRSFLKHATRTGYDWKWADRFFRYLVANSGYLLPKAHYVALTLHAVFSH